MTSRNTRDERGQAAYKPDESEWASPVEMMQPLSDDPLPAPARRSSLRPGCPHAAAVDIDRLVSVSEVAQRGPSWLLSQVESGPMWLTRNSRVVAVIHPVQAP